jgi:hypothetical protein
VRSLPDGRHGLKFGKAWILPKGKQMAIADFLKKVGSGVARGAKDVGKALEPIAERTAQVVSGEAPLIDEEERQRRWQALQADVASNIQQLQSQLAMGQKYGTLNPEQQQQYEDAIKQQNARLGQPQDHIRNLFKTVHGGKGATYQTPAPALPNAVPQGGTGAADVSLLEQKQGLRPVPGVHPFQNKDDGQWYQPMYNRTGQMVNQVVEGYNPAVAHHMQQKIVVSKSHGGPIVASYDPQTGKTYDAQGQEVTDAKPYVKPTNPQMKPGTSKGKSMFAYYNIDQHSWIDSDTNLPVKDFVPQPTFSQTGLYGLDVAYDNNGNAHPVLLNRRNGQVTPAPAGVLAPSQSKSIETARTEAIGADARLRIMKENEKKALDGDQQAQVSLLMNHIGMTLGAQKGTRVNQATIRDAENSAPWTQTIYAKWGHFDEATGDWIYDGYKTGTNLTRDQIEQMVGLAKVVRDVKYQQLKDTAAAQGVNVSIPEFEEKTTNAAPAKPGNILPKTGAKSISDDEFLRMVK